MPRPPNVRTSIKGLTAVVWECLGVNRGQLRGLGGAAPVALLHAPRRLTFQRLKQRLATSRETTRSTSLSAALDRPEVRAAAVAASGVVGLQASVVHSLHAKPKFPALGSMTS